MTEARTMTDEELLDDVAELLSGDLSDLLAADDGTTASPPRLTGDDAMRALRLLRAVPAA